MSAGDALKRDQLELARGLLIKIHRQHEGLTGVRRALRKNHDAQLADAEQALTYAQSDALNDLDVALEDIFEEAGFPYSEPQEVVS